jgi:hypothetical protein
VHGLGVEGKGGLDRGIQEDHQAVLRASGNDELEVTMYDM